MSEISDRADEWLHAMVELKQHVIERSGRDALCPAVLCAGFVPPMVTFFTMDEAREELLVRIGSVIVASEVTSQTPQWMVVASDAVLMEIPVDALSPGHGDMQRALAGGDQRVGQALVATVVTATEEAAAIWRYTYADDGSLLMGEREYHEGGEGVLAEVLRAVWVSAT